MTVTTPLQGGLNSMGCPDVVSSVAGCVTQPLSRAGQLVQQCKLRNKLYCYKASFFNSIRRSKCYVIAQNRGICLLHMSNTSINRDHLKYEFIFIFCLFGFSKETTQEFGLKTASFSLPFLLFLGQGWCPIHAAFSGLARMGWPAGGRRGWWR